ncbi:MAG: iron-containing alcohol dehydrogenase [Chloroflexi bacterium]|nr:iron-containing alcohol dehydrogenase [Chloroflexota bacterium]
MIEFVARFTLPTEIVYGTGTSARLGEEARKLGATKVFLVTDAGVAKSGILADAQASLDKADLPHVLYDKAPTDPDTDVLDQVAALIRANGCDLVVAAGGGSVLCTGKGSAAVASNPGPARDYLGNSKFPNAPLVSIGMPTTAGSGSEVSRHTSLTDAVTKRKEGFNGYKTAPRIAILDPLLLRSVPRSQAIASGVDAFTHALEAYVSSIATPLTDVIALEAMKAIVANLPLSVHSESLEARCQMSLASTMANIACGNAGLGLVHAINGAITYFYKNNPDFPPISYGLLHAILLPHVMEFNSVVVEDKLARLAVYLGASDIGKSRRELARECVAMVKVMLAQIGAPRRLPWEKLSPEQVEAIVSEQMTHHHQPNPRKYGADDIRRIVESSMLGWEL